MFGPDGQAGIDALAELEREHGELPRTPRAKSGSGGRHYYFRWPAEGGIVNRKNHCDLPIDVRGAGGYAVAPPSRNKNGAYGWEIHPTVCELADAPAWLLEWVRDDGKAATPKPAGHARNGVSIVDRAVAYLAKIPPAISGEGGHGRTLEAARAVVFGFDLGPEVGFQILNAHYNPRCQPQWSETELRHKCQEADTVPFAKPRGWLLSDLAAPETSKKPRNNEVSGAARKKPAQILPSYQSFPLAALPPVIREYIDAAAIGCEPALVALPALAVSAGCIGNSRALRLKKGWSEPAIVWALTVAPSGAQKTPAFAAAVDPLMAIQMEKVDDRLGQLEEYEREVRVWKQKKRDERGDAPEEPKPETCLVTTETTVESVGLLLRDNPRGLLLARDELDGWFQSFARYRQGGATDRPHWLELSRAGSLRVHRVSRPPLSVRRAAVSVTGTIQPAVLALSLDAAALAAGLGARFLMAKPPRPPRRWSEAEVSEDLTARYTDLLRGLLALSMADAGKRAPHFLVLTPAAKQIFVDWFLGWGERQDAARQGAEAAALAKLEGYAARLALLHHVVTHKALGVDDLRGVGEQSVQCGITLVEWFATEAKRIYGSLRETEDECDLRELAEWIQGRGGETTPGSLRDSCRGRYPTAPDAEAALSELVETGCGHWIWLPSGPNGGRPTCVFRLSAPETSKTPGFFEVSGAESARNGSREPGEEG